MLENTHGKATSFREGSIRQSRLTKQPFPEGVSEQIKGINDA